jgi:hypothetical protein
MDFEQALISVPAGKRPKAMRLIEQAEQGGTMAAFNQLHARRVGTNNTKRLISVPLGYKFRLVFVVTGANLRFGMAYPHHEYEKLVHGSRCMETLSKLVNGLARPDRPPFRAPPDLPPPSKEDLLEDIELETKSSDEPTHRKNGRDPIESSGHPLAQALIPGGDKQERPMIERAVEYIKSKVPGFTFRAEQARDSLGVPLTQAHDFGTLMGRLVSVNAVVKSGYGRATSYTVTESAKEVEVREGRIYGPAGLVLPAPTRSVTPRQAPIIDRTPPKPATAQELLARLIDTTAQLEAVIRPPTLADFSLQELMAEVNARVQRGDTK